MNTKIIFIAFFIMAGINLNAQSILEGVWLKKSCSGGIVPRREIVKDTFFIQFKGKEYMEGNTLSDLHNRSHFSLKKGKSIFSKDSELLTIDNSGQTFVIRKNNSTLSLVPNAYDAKGCSYIKVTNKGQNAENKGAEIDCILDFDKEIVLKNVPISKTKVSSKFQTVVLGNNLILSFFDAEYKVANAESLTIKEADPISIKIKNLQTSTLKNGDTRIHFTITTNKAFTKEALIQVSYNDTNLLASVAKIKTYQKKYNSLTILTDKVARMLDNEQLKEDCFPAALWIDGYSGSPNWKPYFYDMEKAHSRFGKNYQEDNFFRSCPTTDKMKFKLRFFISKVNAG